MELSLSYALPLSGEIVRNNIRNQGKLLQLIPDHDIHKERALLHSVVGQR